MTEEMTEKEKMLAGQLYDPTDEELVQLREDAHGWNVDYNMTKETEEELREAIMDKLVPNRGEDVYFQGPVSFDYGVFTTIGPRTYFNFNFTCLDCAPVTIGDHCWIGGSVTICGGVTIGEGSVIGAGSVVTRDIPPNSVAAGVPCRVLRSITEEDRMEELTR